LQDKNLPFPPLFTPEAIFDTACAIRYNRASMPPSTGGILNPTKKSGSGLKQNSFVD
jgi:hypothetical protein